MTLTFVTRTQMYTSSRVSRKMFAGGSIQHMAPCVPLGSNTHSPLRGPWLKGDVLNTH